MAKRPLPPPHPAGKQRWRRIRPDDNPRLREALVKLGKRIVQLRSKKNWTQEQFAAECLLYRSHMDLIERGQANLTLSTMEIIAKTLNVIISDLFKDIA